MKKKLSIGISILLFLGSMSFVGCSSGKGSDENRSNVLRVASWDEYICMGGEDSYEVGSRPLYEEFEDWYEQVYGERISVEYVALQDNETMYSKIKMGDSYDLICPSEYMMMKLASEGKLQPLPADFYDDTKEHNYYVQNLSPYIREVFENGKLQDGKRWSEYAAGYMWGTTGFVFNAEHLPRESMTSWKAFQSAACERKITAKDNVRDSYFIGLGMYYEDTLLAYKQQVEQGQLSLAEYKSLLHEKMNDTSEPTMAAVKEELIDMRENLYGLETDEGKMELISGRLNASFQWSGDAVYVLDEAEENEMYSLEYCIPSSASNMWFDGWSIMKDCKNVQAATAFINFLSMPKNVVRNMYYIGYTSCIAGEEVFAYISDAYGYVAPMEGEPPAPSYDYDLSYFFGENHILTTNEEQTRKQLFAQYPQSKDIDRLVVMDYFDSETNERANRMWINIK